MMDSIKSLMVGALIVGLLAAAAWFYFQGGKSEQLRDVKTENAELSAALQKQHELEEFIREQERMHGEDVANIDAVHQKELQDVRAKSDGFIDDVMSGRLRLWDRHAHCGKPGTNAGQVAGVTGVGDAASGAELSEEVERFLELEAGRADQIVVQLTACQAILKSDRGIK